jgi:hypothetical protein
MKRYGLLILAAGGIAALVAGCVRHEVVYVPAQPGAPAAPPAAVEQAPPPPQAEVVPVAPGPDYVWMPGYWSIGVGGAYVWIGGRYALPPRPHAVWVGGHWGRRGHRYVWIGGYWR